MKFETFKIDSQFYVLPCFGITFNKELTGHYEIFFAWFNYGFVISKK